MNFRVVLFLMAVFAAIVLANYAEEENVSLVEADTEAAFDAEVEAQLDADSEAEHRPVNIAKKFEVTASTGKPSNKGTSQLGLRPALIMDEYIRFGAEAKKAKRDLRTISLEPPAAVLPPVLGDVDQKILDMAYDLSFHPRPKSGAVKLQNVKRGAKLLNGINKMMSELQWAVRDGKPAPKSKGPDAKKGKKADKKAKTGKKAAKKAAKKF